MNDADLERKRDILLNKLKNAYGVSDEVISAMRKVPRHIFVPENVRARAYDDTPLPIGRGQTISAPHMVAIMCDLLDVKKGDRILEIGAGSGYHSAVLAELTGREGMVIAVERVDELADLARRNLRMAGYENVKIVKGDGSLGYPENAPYDRINVTCSAPDVPPPLLDQLREGGRMVIPIGRHFQELYLVIKQRGKIKKIPEGGVMFVPLIGEYGFREDEV